MVVHSHLEISTTGQGLYLITRQIEEHVRKSQLTNGLVHLFLQHTSASLIIQENADPTAQQDLEEFLDRMVPENQHWHQHTLEGPDDTTSHLKAALTHTSLQIPLLNGRLALGTWQGLFLWEHRHQRHSRKIVITVIGE
ncbi:MAG: secondary thiamine-phosphate synthase enzyme YjbQ [Bdellovibrionales bacterium]|nr:secondary thiamine-phosphate synthase enzyme YjbQ [Bdellovibrionales bacterium]